MPVTPRNHIGHATGFSSNAVHAPMKKNATQEQIKLRITVAGLMYASLRILPTNYRAIQYFLGTAPVYMMIASNTNNPHNYRAFRECLVD